MNESKTNNISAVWAKDPAHNRKIQGICEIVGRNWIAGGESPNLPYPFIMSAAVGYRHFWIWDTAFNTVGWAAQCDERTKDTYRNHWHWIDHNPLFPPGSPGYGMLPGVVVCDHSHDYYTFKYTQLPLTAWGVWEVYLQDGDRRFLEESLPYLLTYHAWYSRERDIDRDLLIEVGSYNGEIQHARFETLDFKPSLDHMEMTDRQGRLTGERWYGNVELVEMTAFVVLMEKAIAGIALELGDPETARKYISLAGRREEAMNRIMWDPGTGFYYDVDRDTHEPVRVKTVMGFMPMFSGSCTEEQAAVLVKHLTNPDEFWTPFPVATSAKTEPTHRSDSFWRGDTWIMTNFLVNRGLCNYGYFDIARQLTDRSLQMVDEKTCNERHDSITGKDIGVNFASFNSCLLLMIYQTCYGIQPDYRTILVNDTDWGKHLRLGKFELELAKEHGEIRLKTAFRREITVVLPDEWRESRISVFSRGVKPSSATDPAADSAALSTKSGASDGREAPGALRAPAAVKVPHTDMEMKADDIVGYHGTSFGLAGRRAVRFTAKPDMWYAVTRRRSS